MAIVGKTATMLIVDEVVFSSAAAVKEYGRFLDRLTESWPCHVTYRADTRSGHVRYASKNEFVITPSKPGPSDCVWIVPGTF